MKAFSWSFNTAAIRNDRVIQDGDFSGIPGDSPVGEIVPAAALSLEIKILS